MLKLLCPVVATLLCLFSYQARSQSITHFEVALTSAYSQDVHPLSLAQDSVIDPIAALPDSTTFAPSLVLAIEGAPLTDSLALVLQDNSGQTVYQAQNTLAYWKANAASRCANNMLYLTIDGGLHADLQQLNASAVLISSAGVTLSTQTFERN